MKYQYNFGFLEQWKAANPQIQGKTILDAIGSKSNNSWQSWLNCDRPLPVITLLRLCNAFQIPLSAFFRDADSSGEAAVVPGIPMPDDKLKPKNGFDHTPSKRQPGEKSNLDPLDVKVCATTIPGTTIKQGTGDNTDNEKQKDYYKETTAAKEGDTVSVNVGNINSENLKSLIKLQIQHAEIESRYLDSQKRLLDIIATQQNQIANLTRKLDKYELSEARAYGSDMVSD